MKNGHMIAAGVFPARAGMIRSTVQPQRQSDSIPRESGDDPGRFIAVEVKTSYSPRERG